MKPLSRILRAGAAVALAGAFVALTATAPAAAEPARSAAAASPDPVAQAVADAQAQIAAGDHTAPLITSRWKMLVIAYTDVTYPDQGLHEQISEAERPFIQTVVDNIAESVESRAAVDVVPTLVTIDAPLTITGTGDRAIHEQPIAADLNRLSALAEYDTILVTSKGNNGGVSLPAYYSDAKSRGATYSYFSFQPPTSAPGFPGPTRKYEQSTALALHELCHSMSFTNRGFVYPDVHNAGSYGYKLDPVDEWSGFYLDFLSGMVEMNGTQAGVYPALWAISPRFLHRPAMVTVHYVDSDGTTLAPDVNVYGPAGDSYTIEAPALPGFSGATLAPGSGPTTGTFTSGTPSEITFTYAVIPTVDIPVIHPAVGTAAVLCLGALVAAGALVGRRRRLALGA